MNTSQFTLLTSARYLLGVLAMLLTLLFTVALVDDDDEEAEERPEYVVLSQERMLKHDIDCFSRQDHYRSQPERLGG